MVRLRQLLLSGDDKKPAEAHFLPGANVVSGDSDTGKSHMLHCIDYVLGAKGPYDRLNETLGYQTAWLEFENDNGEQLTLSRSLGGGDIRVHRTSIVGAVGEGEIVAASRSGTSQEPDLTSIFLPFCGMPDAMLRKNAVGQKQRLTLRTLTPIFLVNETDIIAKKSPIYGEGGYDKTARQRALSYMLTGLDDQSVVAGERKEVAEADLRGRLAAIEELLEHSRQREPLDEDVEGAITKLDATIDQLSSDLDDNRREQLRLDGERTELLERLHQVDEQLIAIAELLSRYQLLEDRYRTDLERLDFIAEGTHFLGQLDPAQCPVCNQPMTSAHAHHLSSSGAFDEVLGAARAEAAKIIGLRQGLAATMGDLKARLKRRQDEKADLDARLNRIRDRLEGELTAALQQGGATIRELLTRRLSLAESRLDFDRFEQLRALRAKYELELSGLSQPRRVWEGLEPVALRGFLDEIEMLLESWNWPGDRRVEFDAVPFDIKVGGKARQSHGKGVRAVLHAAFVLGLLRYCAKQRRPHPGFVILDSPLTSFKEKRDGTRSSEDDIDPTIEAGFWRSLRETAAGVQVIVFDNKEPPDGVTGALTYEYFAGRYAGPGERRGFAP